MPIRSCLHHRPRIPLCASISAASGSAQSSAREEVVTALKTVRREYGLRAPVNNATAPDKLIDRPDGCNARGDGSFSANPESLQLNTGQQPPGPAACPGVIDAGS